MCRRHNVKNERKKRQKIQTEQRKRYYGNRQVRVRMRSPRCVNEASKIQALKHEESNVYRRRRGLGKSWFGAEERVRKRKEVKGEAQE